MNKRVWRPINLLSRNKYTPNVNGGHIKAGLNTLRCEKGLEHEDWVNFDKIKQRCYGGVAFMVGKHSFGGILIA